MVGNPEFSISLWVVKKKKERVSLTNDEHVKKELVEAKEKLDEQIQQWHNTAVLPAQLFIMMGSFILLMVYFTSFQGQVVAKLPFVPINFIQFLSHLNLPGDDPTDCSFIFFTCICLPLIKMASAHFDHFLFGSRSKFSSFFIKICLSPSL